MKPEETDINTKMFLLAAVGVFTVKVITNTRACFGDMKNNKKNYFLFTFFSKTIYL